MTDNAPLGAGNPLTKQEHRSAMSSRYCFIGYHFTSYRCWAMMLGPQAYNWIGVQWYENELEIPLALASVDFGPAQAFYYGL